MECLFVRIIRYPHPTLRHKSKPLQRVDAELGKMIAEMLELMYSDRGIGLAANQVDLPY
ncbi:MAG: peptide deformylase, partial [Planctomycetes bacterium]|nr:peptide deformylase [Planctomycetota bacterium]